MKFKFNIRKKGILDFPLEDTLNDIFPLQSKKIKLSKDYNIVTATDSRLFVGFQLLALSLVRAYDVNICCYDVGLLDEQLGWCEQIPNLSIVKYQSDEWEHVWKSRNYWQALAKPFYIKEAPFNKIFWIDSDAVVLGDLNEIIEYESDKPLFTEDHSFLHKSTLNPNNLYALLPIDGISCDNPPYLNTGVFLVDKKRDNKLLGWWCYAVEQALENEEILQSLACWDQGAAKWALQHMQMLDCIANNQIRFNYPDHTRQFAYPPRPKALEYFFNSIRRSAYEKAIINHWMGSPKPWERWERVLPITV